MKSYLAPSLLNTELREGLNEAVGTMQVVCLAKDANKLIETYNKTLEERDKLWDLVKVQKEYINLLVDKRTFPTTPVVLGQEHREKIAGILKSL